MSEVWAQVLGSANTFFVFKNRYISLFDVRWNIINVIPICVWIFSLPLSLNKSKCRQRQSEWNGKSVRAKGWQEKPETITMGAQITKAKKILGPNFSINSQHSVKMTKIRIFFFLEFFFMSFQRFSVEWENDEAKSNNNRTTERSYFSSLCLCPYKIY